MREGEDDPGLYGFWPYRDRARIAWPDGKTVAVWVSPNLEYYELDPPANPHRKSWARPHPDVVGYAHRDYGNRVAHWRMADVMTRHGFPGSVSLSVALCQHIPEIVADADARGWEFFSHGIYNTRYSYGMDEAQERAMIEDAIRTVRDATGQTIKGWLAPALTHTPRTLDLIAEYGLTYTCDLYHDDQPAPVTVAKGQLISMPYSLEVNDHYGFFVYNMSPREYADTLIRQFQRLALEGERSGTVMCIPLHAYLIGQPHRIGAFEEVLRHILADGRAWITRSGDIADHFLANSYDAVAADIAKVCVTVLDPACLDYPLRRRGMDHDLYPWSNLFEREPVVWPGGAAVAVPIVVSLEWFPILPSDTPFRAPGHMQTTYPDYRHYTSREYGTRIGFFRLLDAFAAAGVTVSVATNAAIAERYPGLMRDIVAGGHEIVAHSTDMNGTIATGQPEADERALISTALDTLERATGTRPHGWLSIARSQSFATPALLAGAGVGYMLDWVNDDLPYAMTTSAGPIVNLPLNHELSDRQIITVQQQSTDSYAEQIRDAFDWLAAEAERFGGRMLPLHLTPYIIALPYRIGAFEELLGWLKARGAWIAPAGSVVDAAGVTAP